MPKSIMIVDDEQHIVDMLNRYLRKKGYNVLSAVGGQKALDLIRAGEKIDLAVVDLKMPEVNGVTVLKECLKNNINTVVFTASISANTFIEDLNKLGYSANDVLHKPVDLAMFFELIKKKLHE